MKSGFIPVLVLLAAFGTCSAVSTKAPAAEAKASEGTITIPTYPWEDDVNPKFWALESGSKLSTTIHGAIVYPYCMQDHLSRKKVDRTYKALFLENEYLKVTCLPELGGRLHSVLDKTQGKEMFHLNGVIKPGMIAMRGAWISGGVEWNSGPHGHTVTVLSPVDALTGRSEDGSVYLEISNQEQIFRTRWTVRVTLRPGRAFLDERIRIFNPTDGMHPYYFWNCTAFANRPGTRFIYPMTLGTDHNAREFFRWPVDKGRDLSWLKNYDTYQSIFSVNCTHDFFGAYDVDADRGIVQFANHNELGGKKAWTWGEWEFGKVAQKNLADKDAEYIEVQSGPLPTQSDYGMLGPRDQVAWREWWYPVHGLGDGFEYATRDLAAQTSRRAGRLELRLLATGRFPQAVCVLSRDGRELARKELDLTPAAPAIVALADDGKKPLDVRVTTSEGQLLAAFTTPLPIPKVEPPDPAKFKEKPEARQTVEELYLKGRAADRGTERRKAREYYEKALARDPGHVASLRSLAVLDFESGLYREAIARLDKALDRDGDDGLLWFYRGVCQLRLASSPLCRPGRGAGGEGSLDEHLLDAERCGYRAVRCLGTASLGYDVVGRAAMRMGNKPAAVTAFQKAVRLNPDDTAAAGHLILAMDAAANMDGATSLAERRTEENPTALVPRAVPALRSEQSLEWFAKQARGFLGERDFELLEASLVFAELGLFDEAGRVVKAACVDAVPPAERSFLPLYYLAWYSSQRGDKAAARKWLEQAAATHKDRVFASRPEEVEILRYAVHENPGDAQAHLQLGCLLANLGRVEEAVVAWQRAAELSAPSPIVPVPTTAVSLVKMEERIKALASIASIAWRNLGLAATAKSDLARAESCFRKAIAARPGDQTLYRDLAEILLALNKRPEAIRLLETMPLAGMRRAEITVMLAQAYADEKRWDDCLKLLESTPYFVNWEGQDITWRLFHQAHIERGRQRLDKGDAKAALAEFDLSLTYPANLNVGRSNKPQEADAHYWRGQALAALARSAWQAGAAGADVPGQQNEYRQKCREALGDEKTPAAKK